MRHRLGTWPGVARGLGAGLLIAVALLGCNLARVDGPPESDPPASSAPMGDWTAIAPGIERREMALPVASASAQGAALLVRADPAVTRLAVHYSPGAARTLGEWQQALPGAQVLVNGAFFDETDRALGLIVSDGQAYGQSFAGFGGMLQVDAAGARVRSLASNPYQGEALWQAVQAFPMLIEHGGLLAPQGDGFDQRARRTWIGQDRAGRIVLGVTHNLITLADLQAWLLAPDLDLDVAFALDGGRSTGMVIQTPSHQESAPAFDRLPSVVAVYAP
ncbi:MAG: phosphodiester glycosidase family protein [Anaerolineae bacterium]|nr:phosphodiester glycosidase family protein [Anaerolineae bacterium]